MVGPSHLLVRAGSGPGPRPDRPGRSGVVWLAVAAAAIAAALLAERRSRAVR